MRAVWFFGGLAVRGFRRAPLVALLVAAIVLAVVQGWFEPWESPACEDHPRMEACR